MKKQQRIAVVGATGRVGREVVNVLEAEGHDVVAISRSNGVDVITGDGLAQALAGVSTVIDAATGPSPEQEAATAFFTSAARNLQEFGTRAGVQRLVVVSIIGIDRFTSGYQAAKLEHERLSLAGPVPARILRAAQFHEFVPELIEWGRNNGVSHVPKMRTQLVAARTVAEALAGMATEDWDGTAPASIPEIAGPREERLVEAARLLVARRGDRLRLEEVSSAAVVDADLSDDGALLPGPEAVLAGPTFAEWLDEAYA